MYDTNTVYLGNDQTLHIQQCDWEESPRTWERNIGTIYYKNNRYQLGDEELTQDEVWLLAWDYVPETVQERWGSYDYWYESAKYDNLPEEIRDRLVEEFDKHYIYLPVYTYQHSGIAMNTTGFRCPWDSWQSGTICAEIEDVKREYDWKRLTQKRRELVLNLLRAEVANFSLWLNGEVYEAELKCDKCDEDLTEWRGVFYGSDWKENGLLDCFQVDEDHVCPEDVCVDCLVNVPDYPSTRCVGCNAYAEHLEV